MKITIPQPDTFTITRLVIQVDPDDIYSGSHESTWPLNYRFEIDVDTGRILNWPLGKIYGGFWKVVDRGSYCLASRDIIVARFEDTYVPSFCQFCNDSYGDYIYMVVDKDGAVANFHQYFTKENVQEAVNNNAGDQS